MNILFIAEFKITGNTGGVGRVTKTLTEGFERRGYKVYYYAIDKVWEDPGDPAQQFYCINHKDVVSDENVNQLKKLIEDLSIAIIINQSGFRTPTIELLQKVGNSRLQVFTVHHNCIRCLFDNYRQIITNNFKSKPWFRLMNVGIIWSVIQYSFRKKFKAVIETVVQQSDRVVLLSPIFIKELDFFQPKLSEPHKVTAIYNPSPFDVKYEVLDKKENRLIFIGVLKKTQKRVDRLVEIWDTLSRKHPDWHFDILGDGPEKASLQQRFKELDTQRYTFHGFTDPQSFLEKAKFFLLTSDYEGFGMVLLESQSYGVVPIVFDNISMADDIVNDESNGIVIESYNIKEYISRLSASMNNELHRREMAEKCQQSVARFHSNQIVDKWETLFVTVQNEKKSYKKI